MEGPQCQPGAARIQKWRGISVFGTRLRLSLVGDQREPLQLKNGRFTLRRDVVEQGDIEAAKTAFRAFYVAKGTERLRSRVAYYAPKVGVDPSGVDVRDVGHRWASCSSTGKLSFHWKCMMAPQTIIDYVVVHELCHLHHRDHNQEFGMRSTKFCRLIVNKKNGYE